MKWTDSMVTVLYLNLTLHRSEQKTSSLNTSTLTPKDQLKHAL